MAQCNPYQTSEATSDAIASEPHRRPMPAVVAGGMVIVTMWAAVIGFVAQLEGPIYSTHFYSAMIAGCILGIAGPILLVAWRTYVPSVTASVAFVMLWVLGGSLAGYAAAFYWYSQSYGC